MPKIVGIAEYSKFDEFVTYSLVAGPRGGTLCDLGASAGTPMPTNVLGDRSRLLTNSDCNRICDYVITDRMRIVKRLSIRLIKCSPRDEAALHGIAVTFVVMHEPKLRVPAYELLDSRDSDLEARVSMLEGLVNTLLEKNTDEKAAEAFRRLGGSFAAADPRIVEPPLLLKQGTSYHTRLEWENPLDIEDEILLRIHCRGLEKRDVL